jgi:hypothetical protein
LKLHYDRVRGTRGNVDGCRGGDEPALRDGNGDATGRDGNGRQACGVGLPRGLADGYLSVGHGLTRRSDLDAYRSTGYLRLNAWNGDQGKEDDRGKCDTTTRFARQAIVASSGAARRIGCRFQ